MKTVICSVCGIEFELNRRDKKYCSDKCRNKYWNINNKSHRNKYMNKYLKKYIKTEKGKLSINKYQKRYRNNNIAYIDNIRYFKNTCIEYFKPIVNAFIILRHKREFLKGEDHES
jgi:predicted nucleic acid-binding Zn ribbon protein